MLVFNKTLIKRNWLLGMRIQYEVLKEQRAEYGEQVIGENGAFPPTRNGCIHSLSMRERG